MHSWLFVRQYKVLILMVVSYKNSTRTLVRSMVASTGIMPFLLLYVLYRKCTQNNRNRQPYNSMLRVSQSASCRTRRNRPIFGWYLLTTFIAARSSSANNEPVYDSGLVSGSIYSNRATPLALKLLNKTKQKLRPRFLERWLLLLVRVYISL